MTKIKLTREIFQTLKSGDVISNKQDYLGGPGGYDYHVVEGYTTREGEGCIKVCLIFGKDDKYKGQPYNFYESQLDECLGLYKREL